MRFIPIVVAALALAGCSSPGEPTVAGAWGGTEVSMALTAAGGSLSYQCGEGTIASSWSLNADGDFAATGQHFFGGGPAPVQGRTPHPARYAGYVRGDQLELTVTLTDLSQTLGPFHLTRGGPMVRELCL